jgi:uncharacterized protein YcbK (DUF882 family)
MMKLSGDFSRSEFKCNCGKCDYDTVDSELIDVLQSLRNFMGVQIRITSGNRCPEYNQIIGGAKSSYHIRGRAADIQVEGVSPSVIQGYLNNAYPDKFGIGSYSSFTHIDTRTKKARWDG